MSYPKNTTSLVEQLDYNDIYDIVTEVVGTGEDGWGLYNYFSTPISRSNLVRANEWLNLTRDLVGTAYFHITSSTSILTTVTAAEGVEITAYRHNELNDIAQYILANRYTCAEGHYFRDRITGARVNFDNGISSRTLEWGINENYIQHDVVMRFANRLVTRHFFNSGGYLTWTPYHSNNGLNDIDSEWAAFIVSVQNDQATNPIKYDREAYLAQTPGTTATVYPAVTSQSPGDPTYVFGTLSMRVEVFKANSEDWFKFTVTFSNSDSSTLVVSPTVGYWNSTI